MKKQLYYLLIFTLGLFSCQKGDDERIRVLLSAETGEIQELNIQVLSVTGTVDYKGVPYSTSFKIPQNNLNLVTFNGSEELIATAENLNSGNIKELKITLGQASLKFKDKVFKLKITDPVCIFAVDQSAKKSLTDIRLKFTKDKMREQDGVYYLDNPVFDLVN